MHQDNTSFGYVPRPVVMQSDLQSVEKVPFSTFARTLPPKRHEISLARLEIGRFFLHDLS